MSRPFHRNAFTAFVVLAALCAVAPALAAAEGRYNFRPAGESGNHNDEGHGFITVTGLYGNWNVSAYSAPTLLRFDAEETWIGGLSFGEQGTTGLHYVLDLGYGQDNDIDLYAVAPIGLRYEFLLSDSYDNGFSAYVGVHLGLFGVGDDVSGDTLLFGHLYGNAGLSYYSGSFVIYAEALFGYGESIGGFFNDEFVSRDDMNDEVGYLRTYGVRVGVGLRF